MIRPWRLSLVAVVGAAGALVVCAVGQVVAQGGGQAQPQAGTPPTARASTANPGGTGRISGQVVSAETGTPVKRVSITLSGGTPQAALTGRAQAAGASTSVQVSTVGGGGLPPGMIQKQKETDAAGRFEFTGLPAGRFSVSANPQGGFVRPGQPESVQLADAGTSTVVIRLRRAGAITGKVTDESGDPLPRAQLRAARWESVGGVRRLVSGVGAGGFNMTNDLGEYRLWDLPPGEYYVSASYIDVGQAPATFDLEDQKFGFAPTFYPGTASMDTARTVTVQAGHDTPGIDIGLQRAKMGRITALVTDSSGSAMSQRGYVSLMSRHDSTQPVGGMSRRPDGSFVSSAVPPGDYFLVANLTLGDGPANFSNEGAIETVSVNGDDVSVSLRTNKGATVSGKVVVEGTMPEPRPYTQSGADGTSVNRQVRVMVTSRPATVAAAPYLPGSSAGRPTPMRDDGTFELMGLRGAFRVMASGGRVALKSVRRGGQDILATPLELTGTEIITDVEIVLTSETGTCAATVTDANGDPAAGANVLVFSDDATRWFEGSPYVRLARTASGTPSSVPTPPPAVGSTAPEVAGSREPGRVVSGSLIPGRYGVIAFESGTNSPAYDPEALERYRSRAIFITITAGETTALQLHTVKQ
ncbi:MAG: carboxypeptidase-like regulatory domain-containing protein [Acidobacteriota bacterium]